MATTHLEDLPSHLLIEILSRVGDIGDLTNCRLASRTLLYLSRHVSSVSVSLRPDSASTVPYKLRVLHLVSLLSDSLLSLSLSTHLYHAGDSEDDEGEGFDEADDLHLTSVDFLSTWLPLVCERLTELSITDCWSQSCFRRSDALSLISVLCNKLLKLEVRNAWLSVDGLKPMLSLTSLTLVFIRLDDEDLEKINECFPHLQFLSLMDVGGLKRPCIHLSHLKTLFWRVSNSPISLSVRAPNLTELHLSCIEPESLYLETRCLFLLDLMIKTPSGDIKLGHFQNLINLRFNTWQYSKLFRILDRVHTVKTLELNVPDGNVSTELESSFIMISDLVDLFCGLEELKLVGAARYCLCSGDNDIKVCLKRLVIEIGAFDFYDFGIVSKLLKMCAPCEVALLFPAEIDSAKRDVTDKYAQKFPQFEWS